MNRHEALRDENRRLRRLRLIVDLNLARLYQDRDLSHLAALEIVEKCRDAALTLFPSKGMTFDLLYMPRFERAISYRWPIALPAELGTRFMLDTAE